MIGVKLQNPDVPKRLLQMAETLADPSAPLRDLGGHWQRRVKRSMPGKPKGVAAPSGEPPAVHSSSYSHSIIYDVMAGGHEMHLGSSDIRARILHEGGEIHARNVANLSIPISEESFGKRARDFADLHVGAVFRRDGMRKMLLGRGEGEDFDPLFVLQPHVTINPHPHIELTDDDVEYWEGALEDALDREAGIG